MPASNIPPLRGPSIKHVAIAAALFVGFVLLAGLLVGGCKEFSRYQKRADAHNTARAERLKIGAVKARAEQRYQEAVGVKRAQDEINRTLTPLYVQHEAIQAQEAIARSGKNNSLIYVPAGPNGVPLVQDTTRGTLRGREQK